MATPYENMSLSLV